MVQRAIFLFIFAAFALVASSANSLAAGESVRSLVGRASVTSGHGSRSATGSAGSAARRKRKARAGGGRIDEYQPRRRPWQRLR